MVSGSAVVMVVGLGALVACVGGVATVKRDALEDWIAVQEPISYAAILANVGDAGRRSYGAGRGYVLASPSTVDPDYFYHWTRDSALTFKALIDRFIATQDPFLQTHIHDYISAQAPLQTVSNPSGSLLDGSGLGEPRYQPNGTAFTGSWGRPQRDGPPLRATALIAYGKWLLANGHRDAATNFIWPIVKNDLAYVAQYWNETGFDLWEETKGSSFFTSAAQYRALIEGSSFASSIGTSCEGCDSQAPQILCFLQTYWNGEYIVSNTNVANGRTGKDVNSILTTLNTYDPSASCSDLTFQPCSPKALANHKAVTDSFRTLYRINANIPASSGVAVGRYAEDVYYNGNPWYLATLAAAQQLYHAHAQLSTQRNLTITPISLPFWRALDASATQGTYPSSSTTYTSLLQKLRTYADSYLSVVQKYTPSSPPGALAEQFDRTTGAPISAQHLTWSYAAFLTALTARTNNLPASFPWNASKILSPPSTCSSSPIKGSYTPPSLPPFSTWPTLPCPPSSSPSLGKNISLTFNVLTPTTFGQNIFVAGNLSALGMWDPARALPLEASRYRSGDFPLWFGGLDLDVGQGGNGMGVEFKFVKKEAGKDVVWEGGGNRVFVVDVNREGEGCRREVGYGGRW